MSSENGQVRFGEYVTCRQFLRSLGGIEQIDRYGHAAICHNFLDNQKDGHPVMWSGFDAAWVKLGMPYYKVYPHIANGLASAMIDIPTSELKMPYTHFVVRFPLNFFCVGENGDHPATAMSVCMETTSTNERVFYVIAQLEGECSRISGMILSFDTIEECIQKTPINIRPNGDVDGNCHRLLRLAVGVCLLAISQHRHNRDYDVIASLRDRYRNAKTVEERETIAEKSRRRGLLGFNIGRGLALTTQANNEDACGDGSPLSFQYIRGAHWHTVKYGPGKTLSKVVFYMPCIVRPDLPPKPIGDV